MTPLLPRIKSAAARRSVGTGHAGQTFNRLNDARIPCGPVNDFSQALSSPQVLARDMVVDVPLHSGENVRMPGNPIKLSASAQTAMTSPPVLGQHTRSVLTELLGYDEALVESLRALRAIA